MGKPLVNITFELFQSYFYVGKKDGESKKKRVHRPPPLKTTDTATKISPAPNKSALDGPSEHNIQESPQDLSVRKIIATSIPATVMSPLSSVTTAVTAATPATTLQYSLPIVNASVGYISPPPGSVAYLQQWPQGGASVVSLGQQTVAPLVATLNTTDSKIESRMTLAQSYATAAEAKLSKTAEDEGLTPAELAEKKRKEGNMALLELAKVSN